jgi:uncharacterized membrane protein HdeD (DUF308 family)
VDTGPGLPTGIWCSGNTTGALMFSAVTIVSGLWLVLIGVMQIVQAFQIRKDVKAARQTLDAVSEPVAA